MQEICWLLHLANQLRQTQRRPWSPSEQPMTEALGATYHVLTGSIRRYAGLASRLAGGEYRGIPFCTKKARAKHSTVFHRDSKLTFHRFRPSARRSAKGRNFDLKSSSSFLPFLLLLQPSTTHPLPSSISFPPYSPPSPFYCVRLELRLFL